MAENNEKLTRRQGIQITKPDSRITTSKGGIQIKSEGKPISFETGRRRLRIAVTTAGYDDIGEVLEKMEYRFETIFDNELNDIELISKFDVIFLNCNGDCESESIEASRPLRTYVSRGGSIYASDFAAAYVKVIFPERFNYSENSESGLYDCNVVDRGLEQIIGKKIKLNFDLGAWCKVVKLPKPNRKYITYGNLPILISFTYGKGSIIFTSFHNHAQVSDLEQKLLQYLVLKTIAAPISINIRNLGTEDIKSLQEITTSTKLNEGRIYSYVNNEQKTIVFIVNWSENAEFNLKIWQPDGQLYKEIQSNNSPCVVEVPKAEIGIWQYAAIPITVSYLNLPFTVTAGPKNTILKALPLP